MGQRLVSLLRIILGPRGRYVLCWLAALGITASHYYVATHAFSVGWQSGAAGRPDGNYGHTLIDFGGQWLSGRMLAAGYGPAIYSRPAQWAELATAYPRADEAPTQDSSDAERLFRWMVDLPTGDANEPPIFPPDPQRPRRGGPLYPPTHALLFAPLGLLPPREAYHLMQVLSLGLAWLVGAAIAGIARSRLWWPVASAFVMLFPGFPGAVGLGQNSILSLAILAVGWYFVARGRDFAGGVVWSLLAYKPVWAMAFVLVPLLTRRWRMFAGMVGAGALFALATVPFVGTHAWVDWLRIGREAARGYNVIENWIFLGRDLLGIPRRWLLEFRAEMAVHDRWAAAIAGWALWTTVVGMTVIVAIAHREAVRPSDGYGAAFVGIGAWASCIHFIYYDVTLAALPVALLLTNPRRFLTPVLLATGPAPPKLAAYYAPRPLQELPPPTTIAAEPQSAAVLNSPVLTIVVLLLLIEQTLNAWAVTVTVSIGALATNGPVPNTLKFSTLQNGTPWDTFLLLLLWAYCGARILIGTQGRDWDEKCP
jgi:hypothetical protein